MKLSLLLFGIHYLENYNHWFKQDQISINYKNSYSNIKTYIIDYYQNLGYDIDIYFSTYNSTLIKDLINDYQPKNYTVIDKFISNKEESRNLHFVNCLNLCKNSNIDYDLVVITRFDILFQMEFNKVFIDYSKMNVVSTMKRRNRIDDNLYIFSYDKLEQFINICNSYKKISYHFLKNELQNRFKLNYFYDQKCPVHKLDFYKINRNFNNKNIEIFN